jgi:ATP-dependent RNA helicase DDX42
VIEPLPAVDHSQIEYGEFAKNFYTEHEEIERLEEEGVAKLRSALGLRVSGPNPPKPVTSFAHFGFVEILSQFKPKNR